MKKKKSGKKENSIHVRFEYPEAVESKKNLLSSEIMLLKSAKTMKNYHVLRAKELKLKLKIIKKIKSVGINIIKLQKTIPKIEIQKSVKEIRSPEKNYNQSIERELMEIQRKLNSLQV